jgi:CelD/BcsL family acetyltransferase involved in cellulose biosynthesis
VEPLSQAAGSVASAHLPAPGPRTFTPAPVSRLASGRRPEFRCRSITTERAFLELEVLWNELAADVRRPHPFQSWDFAVEWWRHFVNRRVGRATGAFEVIVVHDRDGRVIGIVPLYEEHGLGGPALGRRLQPFGRSYSFEAMADEPTALFRSGRERAALDAVREHLIQRAAEQGWDVAVVTGVIDDGLASRPRLQRRTVELDRPMETAMTVHLPRSWPRYVGGLSKSMRDNLAFYSKRLDREASPWRMWTARSPASVAMATEALIALHRKRSQSPVGKPHCSHIPTHVHASFLRHWFQRLARRNRISLVVMESQEGIRAVQAFLDSPDVVSVYYSGYDADFARFSALTLITAARIKEAIADGVPCVEFPPGSSTWSSRWGARAGAGVRETSIYALSAGAMVRGLGRRCKVGRRAQ